MQSMIATKDAWATYIKSLEELLEELIAQEASATDPNVNTEIGRQIGALKNHLFQASSRQNIAAYSLGVKRDQEQLQTWGGRGETFISLKEIPNHRMFMSVVMGSNTSRPVRVVTTT